MNQAQSSRLTHMHEIKPPKGPSVTIHDYKMLELSNMSMIGLERYAEAMKIAPGQQRFEGAFTKKPSME
jgi:hypothetical protein